jgi:tetratricopeptide (TPR) repeat protein
MPVFALGADPDKVSASLTSAHELASAGQYERAIDAYLKVLKIAPTNRAAQDALYAICEDAVKRSPTSVEAHNAFGNALACHSEYGKARKEFKTAIQLSEKDQDDAIQRCIGRIRRMQVEGVSADDWWKRSQENYLSLIERLLTRIPDQTDAADNFRPFTKS